jgi:uncharacterized membrane protein YeaQ/YmgE (transglycosylase-associated protein family)
VDITSIWSGLVAAVVVGALGRLIAPGQQAIGCFLTLLIGLVGAAIGAAIGQAFHWGFVLTFATQVVIGALMVTPFSVRRRS